MSASRANRNRPLCGAGFTNVTNARESTGANHGRPIERQLERGADETDLVAIDAGQIAAAREHVIHVGEIRGVVVAEAANGKRRRDAAAACVAHGLRKPSGAHLLR